MADNNATVCFKPDGSKKYHTYMECLRKGFRDFGGHKEVHKVSKQFGVAYVERRQRGLEDLDLAEVRALMAGRGRKLLLVPADPASARCRQECKQCAERRRKGAGTTIRAHLLAVGFQAAELDALPRLRAVSEAQANAHVKAEATRWRLHEERQAALRVNWEARRVNRVANQPLPPPLRSDADVHQASINSLILAAREALRDAARLGHDSAELWGDDAEGRALVCDIALRSGADFVDLLGAVLWKICDVSASCNQKRADLLEILAFNMRDCYFRPVPVDLTKGSVVCLYGRLARLLSTLDGVVEGWRVGVSNEMMREQVGSLAARVRDEGGRAEEFEERVVREFGAGNEHAMRLMLEFSTGFD